MALIPPFFMQSVFAIGVPHDAKVKWIGTGFLYGHLVSPPQTKEQDQRYFYALVTNKHVLEDEPLIVIRLNPVGAKPAKVQAIPLLDNEGNRTWKGHSNKKIDVAIIPVDLNFLRQHEIVFSYFLSNKSAAIIRKMKSLGVTEGDSAYILGYPMGLVGEKRQTVLVRGGVIARIQDVLDRTNNEFLVDAQIFPGNSGGPVILKPEGFAIKGTQPQKQSLLIGVVKSYVSYEDIAVSVQTGEPRIIFQENAGLAAVHPIDYVQSLMRQVIKDYNLTPQKKIGDEE